MGSSRRAAPLCTVLLALAGRAAAFNQPNLNLGFTSMLDGGPTEPGLYALEYVRFLDGKRPIDEQGNVLPGSARISGLISLHQLYYLSNWRVFGGRWGGTVVVPVVGASAQGSLGGTPLSANAGGLGDITIGTQVQWNEHALLGRPYAHYFEVDVGLPTGRYDAAYSVNPGNNLTSVNPFYSLTWFFSQKWETSLALNYAYNTENRKTRVRPGQVLYLIYELSREVHPKWRLGAGGYFLKQLADDRARGAASPDSRERAVAVGPVVGYLAKDFYVFVSHFVEAHARNKFQANSTTVQVIHKF